VHAIGVDDLAFRAQYMFNLAGVRMGLEDVALLLSRSFNLAVEIGLSFDGRRYLKEIRAFTASAQGAVPGNLLLFQGGESVGYKPTIVARELTPRIEAALNSVGLSIVRFSRSTWKDQTYEHRLSYSLRSRHPAGRLGVLHPYGDLRRSGARVRSASKGKPEEAERAVQAQVQLEMLLYRAGAPITVAEFLTTSAIIGGVSGVVLLLTTPLDHHRCNRRLARRGPPVCLLRRQTGQPPAGIRAGAAGIAVPDGGVFQV
jgi:hypothetical protein